MKTTSNRNLSRDSTIYNYKLLKRVRHSSPAAVFYGIVMLAGLIPAIVMIKPLFIGIIFFGMPLLHALLLKLFDIAKESGSINSWYWSVRWPWLGYAPKQYVPISTMNRLHFRLFWIVLVLIGCLFPWAAKEVLIFALGVHIWLLLPRLFLLLLLRKYKSSGFLKINESDTSCYKQ